MNKLTQFSCALVLFAITSTLIGAESIGEILYEYRNNEKHIATTLDPNGVPIDPKCKFKTVWNNILLSGSFAAKVPGRLASLTIIKFHYAGAWIAYIDQNGKYHEMLDDDTFIPWESFPTEMQDYYRTFSKSHIKGADWNKVYKPPFKLRTPPRMNEKATKKHRMTSLVDKRRTSGLLCKHLKNNVYIPYSEFPPHVREDTGYYENECYIPNSPIMEYILNDVNDAIIRVPKVQLEKARVLQYLKDGWIISVRFLENGKVIQKKIIFIKGKFPSIQKLKYNHESNLHVFEQSQNDKHCLKCGISDHYGTSKEYFNYMWERQIRTPCNVIHLEISLKKLPDRKIRGISYPVYEYIELPEE